MSRCFGGIHAGRTVSVRDIAQHLSFGRMLPCSPAFGDGESFGPGTTVVFAHSIAASCVSFPAPTCQETSVLSPACSSPPKQPCQNSSPVSSSSAAEAFSVLQPRSQHPRACLPSPRVQLSRHPTGGTVGAATLLAQLVPALLAQHPQPFGSSPGKRLPHAEPFPGVCRLCRSSSPRPGMERPPYAWGQLQAQQFLPMRRKWRGPHSEVGPGNVPLRLPHCCCP